MRILVVNDDGIKSTGLKVLVEKLMLFTKDILVVAPFEEMSATSHKLTLREGLDITRVFDIIEGIPSYSVTGTPADCVKVGLNHFKFEPDLVISGVNNGYNVGNDIIYSGTAAGASEAALNGIKGIAVSCNRGTIDGINYFDEVFNFILNSNIYKEADILNINLPAKPLGIKITHQGSFPFDTKYVQKENGLYYVDATPIGFMVENDEDTDVFAVYHDYVSISPLTVDRTNLSVFNKYKGKNISLK